MNEKSFSKNGFVCADEDGVIWLKAPQRLLNGPCGDIVFLPQINCNLSAKQAAMFQCFQFITVSFDSR